MKVDVYQAFLTVEGKRVRLTKAVAKQFPIRSFSARDGKADVVREPICKVLGELFGRSAKWLFLVQDEEAGLAWEPACYYEPTYGEEMQERGYDVDDPSQVPTVVL